MIPYSRPKRSDLYTLSQSKLLENHTLHSGTYLYSLYMAVPPPPPRAQQFSFALFSRCHYYFVNNILNGTTHSSLRVIKQYH